MNQTQPTQDALEPVLRVVPIQREEVAVRELQWEAS